MRWGSIFESWMWKRENANILCLIRASPTFIHAFTQIWVKIWKNASFGLNFEAIQWSNPNLSIYLSKNLINGGEIDKYPWKIWIILNLI